MTRKQRVRDAIAHRKPDRTPRGELAFENEIARRLIGAERFAALGANERTLAVIDELGADLVDVHQFPMEQVGETSAGPIFRSVLGDEHVITEGSSGLHKPAFQDIEEADSYPDLDPATCLNGWGFAAGGVAGLIPALMYSLYISPVYLLGKWYGEAALAFGIFAATCGALYFTWLKRLPEE